MANPSMHSDRGDRRGPKRLVRLIGGVGLVLVGILGLILPVLPGWLFIIPGLSLLSTEFQWAADLRRMASRRLARIRGEDADSDASSRDDEPNRPRRIA